MSPQVTPAHWAAAAEAVTSGPSQERDVVARVAQALADAEARAAGDALVEAAEGICGGGEELTEDHNRYCVPLYDRALDVRR